MRRFAKIAAVQLVIFAVGLIAIEFALARFLPLPPHGGVYIDRSGGPVRVSLDDNVLRPNIDIVHSASEFSASVHTNALGYRAMSKESRRPDFLFLGDSFAFGHGVSDNEVFAEVFCKARGAACLNLARSGTATFDHVRILRHGLDTLELRPKTVVLTMLSACWLGVAGNDLSDNLARYRVETRSEARAVVRASPAPSISDVVKAIQLRIADFEITKRVMILATSGLKSSIYRCADQSELDAAVRATAAALQQLQALADRFGFDVVVLVVHPYQELEQAYPKTESLVAAALPEKFRCLGTAARLRKTDYYAYDGHFNASGHATVAAILDGAVTGGRIKESGGCRS